MKATKELSRSAACAAKCLMALMKEMKKRGGSISTKEIDSFLTANVSLTDWEKERAGKMQYYRYMTMTQFYSIDYSKAGFIVKKNNVWYLTAEGEEAMKLGEEGMMRAANQAYRKWVMEKSVESDDNNESEEVAEKENIINLEQLESNAIDGIKEFIRKKNPYDFQFMVAALLRAMGYHTPFVAPKGKDGGVDVLAYVDPLGAQIPRIKVQVKHYPDTPIGAPDIRGLVGILSDGDIGLFVTSGTFSSAAKQAASIGKSYLRLIDGDEFIDMWQQFYDKMSDEDKNMLPLKRIAFLGNNE